MNVKIKSIILLKFFILFAKNVQWSKQSSKITKDRSTPGIKRTLFYSKYFQSLSLDELIVIGAVCLVKNSKFMNYRTKRKKMSCSHVHLSFQKMNAIINGFAEIFSSFCRYYRYYIFRGYFTILW